jgi:hypothetical protein
MNRFIIAAVGAMAFPAFALAQQAPGDAKNNPPGAAGQATEQAVPEMKNPGGTDKLHPPQKAMDEATEAAPGKSDSSTGASSGESGSGEAKTWSADEAKEKDLQAK